MKMSVDDMESESLVKCAHREGRWHQTSPNASSSITSTLRSGFLRSHLSNRRSMAGLSTQHHFYLLSGGSKCAAISWFPALPLLPASLFQYCANAGQAGWRSTNEFIQIVFRCSATIASILNTTTCDFWCFEESPKEIPRRPGNDLCPLNPPTPKRVCPSAAT